MANVYIGYTGVCHDLPICSVYFRISTHLYPNGGREERLFLMFICHSEENQARSLMRILSKGFKILIKLI